MHFDFTAPKGLKITPRDKKLYLKKSKKRKIREREKKKKKD